MICDRFGWVLEYDDEDMYGGVACCTFICGIVVAGLFMLIPVLTLIPILYLIVSILVIMEALFLYDKAKPNSDQSPLWFTLKRKVIAFFDIVFITGIIGDLKWIYDQLYIVAMWFEPIFSHVWEIVGYCVGAVIVLILFYVYIWLNSKKYKK